MSPRSLTSAPTGAYCCSSARSVNSRSGSLLSPGAFPEGRATGASSDRGGRNSHGRAVRRRTVLFALIQLRLAVQRGKQVRELAHGLGGAQEEHAARVQCVVEQGDELLLQFPAHIDQQVAATDQVEFGERRVFDHVLLGKDHHVADAFVDAVGAAVRLLGRKSAPVVPARCRRRCWRDRRRCGPVRWPGGQCRWRRPAP